MMRYSALMFLFGCGGMSAFSATIPPVENDSQYCEPAEQHLSQLCSEGSANLLCCQVVRPLKNGKTFQQFCREKEFNGIGLNAKCMSQVMNCNDIDACTGSK